jgi:hypothetical protein
MNTCKLVVIFPVMRSISESQSVKTFSLDLPKTRDCQNFANRHTRVIKQRFSYTRKQDKRYFHIIGTVRLDHPHQI